MAFELEQRGRRRLNRNKRSIGNIFCNGKVLYDYDGINWEIIDKNSLESKSGFAFDYFRYLHLTVMFGPNYSEKVY